jgi:signal transduction histidine kinase
MLSLFQLMLLVVSIVIAVAVFLLGFFIYLNNKKSHISKAFFAMTFAATFWIVAIVIRFNAADHYWILTGVRLSYVAATIIGFLMNYFSYYFPIKNTYKSPVFLTFLMAVFVSYISFFTPYIIEDEQIVDGEQQNKFGSLFFVFTIYFPAMIAWAIYNLLSKRHSLNKLENLQINFILIGILLSTSIGFTTNQVIPLLFKTTSSEYYGPFSAIFFILFAAYAIIKYRLFEIKVVLTEYLVGLMGITLLAMPFLMPTVALKIMTILVFVFFCVFGFYLIKTVKAEGRRREEAELAAVRERELRREAETLSADLKRLDAAKTQFLLSTQHHLRSPLSVIQGYLSMANEGNYGKIPARAKEKINVALEATQKLIRLVNDLLDIAHFQMNKGMAAKELTDVVKLIVEIIADLKKSAQDKNIYLRLESPSSPIPLISIDPRGIREAIYNIADNAIKYTQAGGVTVSLSVVLDCLRVSVADTGIGMNKKELQGLFNRTFERGEKARNVNVNGKGIGLYLAAQMVINNGGRIRAESDGWEKGSEFIIELPMDGGEKTKNDGLKSALEN